MLHALNQRMPRVLEPLEGRFCIAHLFDHEPSRLHGEHERRIESLNFKLLLSSKRVSVELEVLADDFTVMLATIDPVSDLTGRVPELFYYELRLHTPKEPISSAHI